MGRFAMDTLDAQDAAFVESMVGISEKLEALKIVFPSARHERALEALQRANQTLTAAAITVPPLRNLPVSG